MIVCGLDTQRTGQMTLCCKFAGIAPSSSMAGVPLPQQELRYSLRATDVMPRQGVRAESFVGGCLSRPSLRGVLVVGNLAGSIPGKAAQPRRVVV